MNQPIWRSKLGKWLERASIALAVSCGTWLHGQCVTQQNVSSSISGRPPRAAVSLIYHATLHKLLGYLDGFDHSFVSYDGTAWTTLAAPPLGLHKGAAWIYDSTRNVGLLFGGGTGDTGASHDLFSYDGHWQQLTWSGVSPPDVPGARGAFDPNRGRAIFVVISATSPGAYWDTWEWTGLGWEKGPQLGPFAPDVGNPFVFDPSRNIGFMVGQDPDTCDEAVWFYRPGTTAGQSVWEQQPVTGSPFQGRIGTAIAYDPYRHRVFRCLGRYDHSCSDHAVTGYVPSVDTWNFVTSRWDHSTPYSLPSDTLSRSTLTVGYDTDRDVLVIAGGSRAVNNNGSIEVTEYDDTWEAHPGDPGIAASSGGATAHCAGDTAVFSVTGVGSNFHYVWFHNAVLIPGANSPLLVLNNLSTADAGNYVGRVENDCGYVDTPIIRLQVKGPITIHRPAIFPDCSLTCLGSDVSIFPPDPRDLSLSMHLQKWVGSWVDVRVSTPLAPTNFVFQHVDRSFTGNYRFYIDGSPCDGYADSEHFIQVGFDITQQPVSLNNVRPCSNPTFTVGSAGSCALPQYSWFKDDFQFLAEDDGHFRGVHTDTLTIEGARYEDEGSYGCVLVDTNQCNYTTNSLPATLRLVPAQWVLRSSSGPSARYGPAMVYDSARGVTVLFGGGRLSEDHSRYEEFNDLWEWDGAHWRQRTTSSTTPGWAKATNTGYWYLTYTGTPVPRREHAMAYDSRRGRIVLFGGRSTPPDTLGGFDTVLGDTWEWDGLNWQCRATNGPTPRRSHAMAYDSNRGVTVLYGGSSTGDPYLVWEWDGNHWKSNAPPSASARNVGQDIACMAYDSFRRVTLYGPVWDGFTGWNFWTWNGSDWSSQGAGFENGFPSPPYGAMVFDSYRRRPVYFGGQQNRFGGSTTASFFEGGSAVARARWSLQPDVAATSLFVTNDFIDPSIVIQIRQHTDPLSDFLWNRLSDATRQTLTNGSATIRDQIAALSSNFNVIIGSGPIYNPQSFSGVPLSSETLAFQRINLWWPLDPSLIRLNRLLLEDYYPAAIARSPSTPPGRMQHAMAYDSRRHATVVFGGLHDPDYPPQLVGNETWELLAFDQPIIIEPPPSQYQKRGESIAFRVDARAPAGGLLTYQWYFGKQVMAEGGRVSGASKDTLTLRNITPTDAGQYWVRVSDECGFTDSFPALLTLNPTLQVFSTANALKLIWSDAGVVLEQADAITGPWTPVPGAIVPFDIASEGPGKFFRLRPTGR